ncbi:hypothetical protein JCM8547_001223 [Rhodosporidiobolus lusitaniae]
MLAPTLLAALIASASSVEAFWRLPCGNSLVIERADSIVSPGQVSGHVHNILGASNFGLQTSFEEMRASECTSCLVKQDMSNYWTPHLYFQWANGSFSSAETTGGGLIYYLPRYHPSDTTNVTAFPDGLRMLTGNPFKRSYDSSSLMDQAIGWNCLGADVAETRQPYLPPYNCPNGLRGEIRFPSCWNGVDLDSSDHFSHMAYPEGGESGPCPSTHPVRLVTLFYEIMWSVDPWKNVRSQAMNPEQPFVLAMGDASGYGYHGDFFNGWDRAVLQEAIDTCTSDSGIIEYCKVFDLYESGHQCHKSPEVDEVVTGLLPSLPGCNPVTGAGANAVPCSAPAPALLDSVAYSGNAPPAGTKVPGNEPSVLMSYTSTTGSLWSYEDCYSDLVNGRALSNGLSTVNKTVESCLEACQAKNYTLCGVEYHGECWGGNTLGGGSTAQGASACGLTCTDNPLQYCGGTGGVSSAAFELYVRSDPVLSTTASVPMEATGTVSSASIPVASTTSSSVSSALSSTTTVASSSVSSVPVSTASVAPSSSSTTTTTVSTTTTTTTTSAAASTSASKKLVTDPNWTYQGCYQDLLNGGRALPNGLSSASWTVESCLAAATAKNYSVAGVTYGGECWAANALTPYTRKKLDSNCNMNCNSDSTKQCGGNGLLDVYYSTVRPVLTGPTVAELKNFGRWTYDACYQDLVGGKRTFSGGLTNSNKTVEACLSGAEAKGATYAALSYYGECYYSTSTTAPTVPVLAETSCRYPCAGNPNEMCGGSGALSTWKIDSTMRARGLTFAQRKAVALKRDLKSVAASRP